MSVEPGLNRLKSKKTNKVRRSTNQRERALLVGVVHGRIDRETVSDHLDELALLAETAGAEVAGRVVQQLSRINPRYFLGKGKAEEVAGQAKTLDIQLIIFDEDLSPAQIKNYAGLLPEIKVLDRSALILDIFRQHAQTREAKVQVELAHLEYLLPRLTRQWTHLERQMGGIGTRAGMGEAQIEIDRRLIRTRIARLKKDLGKIEKERITQTRKRRKFFRVALVGYTNAGKSTLMNALSGSDLFIQDQLFATLDTTVRKVQLNENHSILLSDTVGFIRKLPHHLVASFRSTLKEVIDADLILLVLDGTSRQIKDHLGTIMEVLHDLGADQSQMLKVINKIDLIDVRSGIGNLKRLFPEAIMISALDKLRLDDLLNAIGDVMEEDYQTAEIEIPYSEGKSLALIQEEMEVLEREYNDLTVRLKIKGSQSKINKILGSLSVKPQSVA